MMNRNNLIDFCASCFNDPVTWVKVMFPWGEGDLEGQKPDVWQLELLQAIADGTLTPDQAIRVAVASGHGIGKSACVAFIILWAMSTRPHLAGVITANTASQLKDKTWRELSIWHKRLLNKDWFKWTATKFYQVDHPETWFVSAVPWSKERPEAFAGLHAKYVLMIFDEASAVDDIIYETAEGAMTTPGAIWLCLGNPTRNTGKFYEIHHRLKHRWHCMQIDSRNARMANKREIDNWAEDYGEDSDFFKVRVKGEFPLAGSNQFIPIDIIEGAINREVAADGKIIMGVDVARFGDDASVICIRQGLKVLDFIKFRKMDTMFLANKVIELAIKYKIKIVNVDGGGVGGGVVDRLREKQASLPIANKFIVNDIQFGSSAKDDIKYFNKRAELWGNMKDWLKKGSIPNDLDLKQDLKAPEYGFAGDKGQIQLESKKDMKKRGLASPDVADALAITLDNLQVRNYEMMVD